VERNPFISDRLTLWQRYGLALVILAIAIAVRLLLAGVDAPPFVTFYPAVAIIVFLCGFGPGIAVLLLGSLAANALTPPLWTFKVSWEIFRVDATYWVSGLVVCLIVNQLHAIRRRLVTALDAQIAAQREAEAAKAEAQRANIAKSKFLAAASHDLRQPVQSLVLLTQVLQEKAEGTPLAQVATLIDQSLDGLRMMLTSLLEVSRLDAGVLVTKLQPVALGEIITRLGAEYQIQAEAKGLALRLVGTRAVVRTDPALLERMLRNLVENAIRYTPTGGVVIGCRHQGSEVRVDVADTGIGIDDDDREAIFEEFYQIGNEARDRSLGLGLGLSNVQRLSQLLGARITLRSRLGRGSCFGVVLPRAEGEVRTAASKAHAGDGAHRLVMIIEDEEEVRTGLEMALSGWGYRTATAPCGEAAVALAREGVRPDAILSDFRLGQGMNGIETVKAIRMALGENAGAVIITGDTATERIREVHGNGLAILHKPFGADELEVQLKRAIKRRHQT
jgi:two-component system, sensor histidine kinase